MRRRPGRPSAPLWMRKIAVKSETEVNADVALPSEETNPSRNKQLAAQTWRNGPIDAQRVIPTVTNDAGSGEGVTCPRPRQPMGGPRWRSYGRLPLTLRPGAKMTARA